MGLVKDPRSGKLIYIPEKYGTDGKDVNLEQAVAKGYEPVQLVMSPDRKKKAVIPFTGTDIKKAMDKGWKLPHQFIEPEEATFARGGTVAEQEIRAVATKNKVPFEELDSFLEYAGAVPDYRSKDFLKANAGMVGRTLGMNIPQFLYRESQEPNVQQALSEIQELANKRMSKLQTGAEIAGSLLVPGAPVKAISAGLKAAGLGAKTAAAVSTVGTGVTAGAVQQAATSKEGEELKEAVIGAVLGGGLGGLAVRGAIRETAAEIAARGDELFNKMAQDVQEKQGKTIFGLVEEKRAKSAGLISARQAVLVGEAPVTADTLESLGKQLSTTAAYKKILETRGFKEMSEDQQKQLLRELGSVDLDRKVIDLARELGWTGAKVPTVAKIAKGKRDSYAKAVANAKQYVQEIRVGPEGADKISTAFNRMTDKSLARNVMRTQLKYTSPETHANLRSFAESIIDGKYVVRGIDRRLGSTLENTLLDLDNATNQLTGIMARADVEVAAIAKKAKKLGVDTDDMRVFIERGRDNTDEAKGALYDSVMRFYGTRLEELKSLGLDIKTRENYFPHTLPSIPETISRIQGKLDDVSRAVGTDISKLDPTDSRAAEVFATIKNDFPELIQAVELVNRTKIHDGSAFLLQAKRAVTPGGSTPGREFTEASALFQREDKIPDFLLVNKLEAGLLNWTRDTYRHILIRDSLSEITRVRDIAAEAGDTRAAKYLTGLLQDMTGLRPGTLATMTAKLGTSTRVWADRAIAEAARNPTLANRVAAAGGGVLRQTQEVWPTILNMAYPNFLGLKPAALAMNISQLGTMLAPELGGDLASRYMLKGMAQATLDFTAGSAGMIGKKLGIKSAEELAARYPQLALQQKGMMAVPWSQDMINAMQSDLKQALPTKVFSKISQSYSNAAMFLYSQTEVINRAVTVNIGRDLAADLLKKDAAAMAWLQRMASSGGKRTIVDLIQKGDSEKLTQYVQEYLLSKSIFNYTRQSMSNFGRAFGPMFSMFTKWPSSVAGEILEQYAANGMKGAALETTRRYLAPWVALGVASGLMQRAAEEEGWEPQLRAMTGAKGVGGWAPVTSLEALLGGEFLKSPAADIVSSVGKIATNPLDEKKWTEAIDQSLLTFFPGMALLRFGLQDLPRLAGEDVKSFKPTRFVLGLEEEE